MTPGEEQLIIVIIKIITLNPALLVPAISV